MDAEAAILVDRPQAAAWLDVMSHQAYGPRVAIPRLLRLLDRLGVRSTFFVPGWVAERYPAGARAVRDAGHEIGHHGYFHEGSRAAGDGDEERWLLRGLEALDSVLGLRPVGYRAPNWEVTYGLPGLLARHGFRYDSSLMDSDYPYVLGGPGAGLVELPAHWSLDDWEPYNYLPGITGTGVILSPDDVVRRWSLELEAIVDEGGLFNLTMHPFVSGRASRAAALGGLIERAQSIGGVWVATCGEIAEWVARLGLEPVVHEPPTVPGP